MGSRRSALVSMSLVFLLIFLLIPWQVAFLGAWIYHFYTCAMLSAISSSQSAPLGRAVPLITRHRSPSNTGTRPQAPSPPNSPSSLSTSPQSSMPVSSDTSLYNQHLYLLLLMTWLLPIAAPVLAVWVRTIMGAGIQAVWTSGSGWGADRNALVVAPWLVSVEWAGIGGSVFVNSIDNVRFSPRYGMLALSLVAFFVGPRASYAVFEVASVVMALVVVLRIGPRYWGGRW